MLIFLLENINRYLPPFQVR